MAETVEMMSRRKSQADAGASASTNLGAVVPMRNIDLDTVVETVRVLRLMNNKTLLDGFNQRRDPVEADS